jgi:hypothetical protein
MAPGSAVSGTNPTNNAVMKSVSMIPVVKNNALKNTDVA